MRTTLIVGSLGLPELLIIAMVIGVPSIVALLVLRWLIAHLRAFVTPNRRHAADRKVLGRRCSHSGRRQQPVEGTQQTLA